jgi:flagellar biosynthesis/type III secretory pathway protein FliH
VLHDEEAVGEVISSFPTRDADELATRDFVDARVGALEGQLTALEAKMDAGFAVVDARFASVDARMDAGFAAVESRFASVDARMDTGFSAVDARMQVGFAEQRAAIESTLHTEIRTMTRWAVGTIIAVAGLLLALGVLA